MADMPDMPSTRLGEAGAWTEGDTLVVTTGALERRWRRTGSGLVTTGLKCLRSGREWVDAGPGWDSDWELPGLVDRGTEARLVGVTARESDDDGFTSRHLEVATEIECPAARLSLRHVVWAYPGAPGLRTQLLVKALDGFEPVADAPGGGRVEHLPVRAAGLTLRAVGYYAGTQNRNTRETEILRQELVAVGVAGPHLVDWASLVCLDHEREDAREDEHGDARGGLILLKESHKCVNTPEGGADTGAFVVDETGIAATGWGLTPDEFAAGRYRACWAHWVVVHGGGRDERECALKVFDRCRYPVDPERDIYVMANTWGSSAGRQDAQRAAREENVLREIESQADLGIDVQQIDDGWQGKYYPKGPWRPTAFEGRYPEGWRNVKAAADAHGVRLGLWAAWTIPTESLLWNFNHGGFRYYKLDFARLDTMDKVELLMGKARELITHSAHKVRINWDVTEKNPRVGYFFGREYGNIYLENRKPEKPAPVVYTPYLVLRDAWQLARYVNLGKFQITVQNVDRVDRDASDACRHGHAYCVAITLMGSPIFFQQTHFYSEEARDEIRPLIALYKEHRREMFEGYVFPIGETPDNASWAGFQSHIAERDVGYLTIFRENGNGESSRRIALRFLAGKTIGLRDLRSGEERTVVVGDDGGVSFGIERPADFLFCRYEIA